MPPVGYISSFCAVRGRQEEVPLTPGLSGYKDLVYHRDMSKKSLQLSRVISREYMICSSHNKKGLLLAESIVSVKLSFKA